MSRPRAARDAMPPHAGEKQALDAVFAAPQKTLKYNIKITTVAWG
jgi:hypothetical protein